MRQWWLVVTLALWPVAAGAPLTFTVTTTADNGVGSLRQAIEDANLNPGLDTITFDIAPGGPQTIAPAASLPDITEAVVIDGQTQPGFVGTPIIEIDGTNAGGTCLSVGSSGTTVRGLVINRCSNAAVALTGSSHVVEGNYLGTNAAGTAALAGSTGISITDGLDIRIGGADTSQRNVISGNPVTGITFSGVSSGTVQGNYIGTNAAGSAAIANGYGILLSGTFSESTISDNVISGNTTDGIRADGPGVTNDVIIGNRIGTNADGTAALKNNSGIFFRNGPANNRIGGTTAADRNLISGNGFPGIFLDGAGTNGNRVEGNYIGTNLSGTAPIANPVGVFLSSGAANNTIGGTVAGAGNVISGNTQSGIGFGRIQLYSAINVSGTVIAGNLIGTNAAGTAALPNLIGIQMDLNAVNTTIGGTVAAARNVISGNTNVGIFVREATSTAISGNYIGTDITGTIGLGNRAGGVRLFGGALTTVGGTTPSARNVISGNTTFGVFIGDYGTLVQGNYIGTDVTGARGLGNTTNGVGITGSNNTIGGTAPGQGNVISGNLLMGVDIYNPGDTTPRSNVVAGNLIGTNAAGNAAIPNGVGVRLYFAAANTIGGTAAGSRNVISGNQGDGVLYVGGSDGGMFWSGSDDNLIQGNFIGTDSTGTASLGNAGNGVSISDGARTQIGGTAAGAGNRIWFNGGTGVRVFRSSLFKPTTSSLAHAIRRNSMAGQTRLGIDLGEGSGVTPNDPGDGDVGPNTLQNFPVLVSAELTAGTTVVSGTLNSTASTTFDIEIFDNAACDPSGYGEGLTFAASTTVTTDAKGNGSFSAMVPSSTTIVTATATNPAGNTSEFSACLTAVTRAVHLDVTRTGSGTGTVTSAPVGITCGATCGAEFDVNTTVTLTATPAAGSRFARWSGGGCSGMDTCQVTMTESTAVTATFIHQVTLQITKLGQGTVTINGTTSCGATCSLFLDEGTAVSLAASPAPGYSFTEWLGGGCSGTGTCQMTMTETTAVTATFIHQVTLQITKLGQGTVTINGTTSCGATCSLLLDEGTAVSLAASPAPGYSFTEWLGGGCSGNGGCGLTLTADTTVVSQFGFSITPLSIGPARVGTPFNATFTGTATGPLTFQVLDGTLPPGLALSTAGALTGTPTALGRFTFGIGAIDPTAAIAGRIYTVDVNLAKRVTTGAGEGGGPHVRTFEAGGASASGPLASFFAYSPSFTGGVRVAVGDVTGDGTADLITAPGPGSALVRVFDGVSGANVRAFDAFDAAPDDGVYVAAGDVNGDGRAEIIVGAGGSPPLVRVFDGVSGALRREFLADEPSFAGGVRVAAGDVNGDGWADILTAAGPGGSPWVGVWDSASEAQVRSFFAYAPGFSGGVYVAAGDVNGDGVADIVTGAGAGGGPHVRVFDGRTGTEQYGFFAYAPAFAGGVRVAAGDVNGDGRAEVITGAGPGGAPQVRVWDGATLAVVDDFVAYAPAFSGGVFVAVPVPLNRMSVDTPIPGSAVGSPFLVAGWAAAEGGGVSGNAVGAIHAWAYPVAGGPPLFAGATALDGPRADVAALLGGQFTTSGYNLVVTALPPGTYDLVVFVIGANSGTAIDRRVLRITVQ